MVTREQLEIALDDETKESYITKDNDRKVRVISLLRERIPYESVKSIIGGAEHDVLYLCDVDEVLEWITEEDLIVLADCNVFIDDDVDSLALFV